MSADPPVLVADIGGTNARFALASGATITPLLRRPTAEIDDLSNALKALVSDDPRLAAIEIVALAGGGPVVNGRIRLTNAGLDVDPDEIAARCGFARVLLMNDFEAVAWSLPVLAPRDLHPIGSGSVDPSAPKVVIGPGTGLGVAAWIPVEGHPGRPVATEGGHVTLAARTPQEAAVIQAAAARHGHVSAERLVSGPGLVEMLQSIAPARVRDWPTPPAISEAAATGAAEARQVMALFFDFLGTVAADLAVSYGAKGGIYLSGGILRRMVDRFEASGFRARFEDKGRFRSYLEAIPTFLVLEPEPAFIGLAHAARTAAAARVSADRKR